MVCRGKELLIRFTARAFRDLLSIYVFCKLLSVYVFSSFSFSFEGRIWDPIVSVPDHCLSFYFLSEEILCPTEIPNGNLSSSCGRRVGHSCDSFTCIHGYNAKAGVEAFNCTEAGSWDYDLSSLCVGMESFHSIP